MNYIDHNRPAVYASRGIAPTARTSIPGTFIPAVAPRVHQVIKAYSALENAHTHNERILADEQVNLSLRDFAVTMESVVTQSLHQRGRFDDERGVKRRGLEVHSPRMAPSHTLEYRQRVLKHVALLASLLPQMKTGSTGKTADMNHDAGVEVLRQQALFIGAFDREYQNLGGDLMLGVAKRFFETLGPRVEGQIQMRGGSGESLERRNVIIEAFTQLNRAFRVDASVIR